MLFCTFSRNKVGYFEKSDMLEQVEQIYIFTIKADKGLSARENILFWVNTRHHR